MPITKRKQVVVDRPSGISGKEMGSVWKSRVSGLTKKRLTRRIFTDAGAKPQARNCAEREIRLAKPRQMAVAPSSGKVIIGWGSTIWIIKFIRAG